MAAAHRVGDDPAADSADAHRCGQNEEGTARKHGRCPRCPRVSRLAGDALIHIQSGASYLLQDFVMFFHVSCESLPGQ